MALRPIGLWAIMILWQFGSLSIPSLQPFVTLFDGPIVSTSANPQGLPAATSGFKVKRYFSKALDYQTPGQVGGAAKASEIRDLLTGEVIRQG